MQLAWSPLDALSVAGAGVAAQQIAFMATLHLAVSHAQAHVSHLCLKLIFPSASELMMRNAAGEAARSGPGMAPPPKIGLLSQAHFPVAPASAATASALAAVPRAPCARIAWLTAGKQLCVLTPAAQPDAAFTPGAGPADLQQLWLLQLAPATATSVTSASSGTPASPVLLWQQQLRDDGALHFSCARSGAGAAVFLLCARIPAVCPSLTQQLVHTAAQGVHACVARALVNAAHDACAQAAAAHACAELAVMQDARVPVAAAARFVAQCSIVRVRIQSEHEWAVERCSPAAPPLTVESPDAHRLQAWTNGVDAREVAVHAKLVCSVGAPVPALHAAHAQLVDARAFETLFPEEALSCVIWYNAAVLL
ncbi:MAG: hypothetical protein EOO41_05195, partial [Methanobacteriota archaeon]